MTHSWEASLASSEVVTPLLAFREGLSKLVGEVTEYFEPDGNFTRTSGNFNFELDGETDLDSAHAEYLVKIPKGSAVSMSDQGTLVEVSLLKRKSERGVRLPFVVSEHKSFKVTYQITEAQDLLPPIVNLVAESEKNTRLEHLARDASPESSVSQKILCRQNRIVSSADFRQRLLGGLSILDVARLNSW